MHTMVAGSNTSCRQGKGTFKVHLKYMWQKCVAPVFDATLTSSQHDIRVSEQRAQWSPHFRLWFHFGLKNAELQHWSKTQRDTILARLCTRTWTSERPPGWRRHRLDFAMVPHSPVLSWNQVYIDGPIPGGPSLFTPRISPAAHRIYGSLIRVRMEEPFWSSAPMLGFNAHNCNTTKHQKFR